MEATPLHRVSSPRDLPQDIEFLHMVDEAGLSICKFSRYIHKKRHLRRDVEPKPDGPDDGSDTDTDTDIDPPLPRLEEMLKEEQYGMISPRQGWPCPRLSSPRTTTTNGWMRPR